MEVKPLDKILSFAPGLKQVIWGGNRIARLKGEPSDADNIGESWEISSLSGHESVVDSGSHKGMTITELSLIYGADLLGERSVSRYGNEFPLLIKIIDARQILSMQVHPSDELAFVRHNRRGKSEMWYVIDADKDARIYTGLKAPLTPAEYTRRVEEKTIMDVVASYDSMPGQFYYIPSGTLHSIGAGNLIAEIQESSDITYRVYDHDRVDSEGKHRQLHTEAACEAIDYRFPNHVEPTARIFEGSVFAAVTCDQFEVDYIDVTHGRRSRNLVCEGSFSVLMVVNGSITVHADEVSRTITAGHTVLIPAYVKRIVVEGPGKALMAHI